MRGGAVEPFSRGSRHSNVISNSYLSPNFAGLFLTSTPRRVTTDILAKRWLCGGGGRSWCVGHEAGQGFCVWRLSREVVRRWRGYSVGRSKAENEGYGRKWELEGVCFRVGWRGEDWTWVGGERAGG